MKFVSIRDLRNNIGRIRESLNKERELVVTSNGRPIALLTEVDGDNLEDQIKAVRRARANLALERVREAARKSGADKMSMKEIERVISEVRKDRKRKKPKSRR